MRAAPLLLLTTILCTAGDVSTTLWYGHPAERWENALPLGNGRLGGMVFGGTNTEQIALNEDTYWSGGPYSTVVKGGREVLPELQRLVFAGEYQKAHQLFGRRLMGYPVKQQKYQALGNLVLKFEGEGAISNYRNELKLDEAVVRTSYSRGGVRYLREVFASAPDQVIAVRLSADRPGSLSFSAQLRGFRNTAHSNYATDYFRMDGFWDERTRAARTFGGLHGSGGEDSLHRAVAGRGERRNRSRGRRSTAGCGRRFRHAPDRRCNKFRRLQRRERRSGHSRRAEQGTWRAGRLTRRSARLTLPITSICSGVSC